MAILGVVAILTGDEADLPVDNDASTEGRLYYANDTGKMYRDTGSAWAEKFAMPKDGSITAAKVASDVATQAELDAVDTLIDNHIADIGDAHDASAISFAPDAGIAATDVQAAIVEDAGDLAAHLADATAAHAATAIAFTPAGTIAATTVQAAIEEVASEAGGGGGHEIQDDGSPLTARAALNFIPGASGVTITDNSGDDSTDIDFSSLTGGGGHTIEDDGSPLTARSSLNFIPAVLGIPAISDDSGDDATVIDFTGLDTALSSTVDAVLQDPGDLIIAAPVQYTNVALSSLGATVTTDTGAVAPGNIVDNNEATFAAATLSGSGQNYRVDLQSAKTIAAVRVYQRESANIANSMVLESSPDDSTWTTRHTFGSMGYDSYIVALSAPATARYWRFRKTSGANGWNLTAAELFEATGGEPGVLPVGSANQVVTSINGRPTYSTPVAIPTTAKGDLAVGAATAQVDRALASNGATVSAINMGSPTTANFIDGNDGTSGNSTIGNMIGQTIRIDLGSEYLITHARLVQSGGANQSLAVNVESSDDDTTWYFRHQFVSTPTDTGVVALTTPVVARYWRFRSYYASGNGWNVLTTSLFAGAPAGTPARLAAGANGTILMADSAETLGVKWAQEIANLAIVLDGSTGIKGDLIAPWAGTIESVTMLADQSGSMVVDIWKDTYANYPPVVGDTITASAKPTISAATKSQDSTLTGWTKTFAAGDIWRFNVDSVTTITRVVLVLKIRRTA